MMHFNFIILGGVIGQYMEKLKYAILIINQHTGSNNMRRIS